MVLSHNKLSNKLLHILAYGRNNLQSSSVSFAPMPYGPQKGRGIYANRSNKVNIVQPTISTSQLTLSEYLKENIENISLNTIGPTWSSIGACTVLGTQGAHPGSTRSTRQEERKKVSNTRVCLLIFFIIKHRKFIIPISYL